jgi:hypothetical protein
MTIDEFLAMAGIPNTGSGEYVSAGTGISAGGDERRVSYQ